MHFWSGGKLHILSAVFHWTVLMDVVRGAWLAAISGLIQVTEKCLSQPGEVELSKITDQSRNVANVSKGTCTSALAWNAAEE